MIYLQLFLTFFEIGAVSFGGGYGMISLIRERMLYHGWLNEEELLNMIAVAESSPGPIAVNIATFVGSSQGGILGAFLATLGVVTPAFLIILLISVLVRNLLRFEGVKAFLNGVRPCVIGMIIATAATMFLSNLIGFKVISDIPSPDFCSIFIFALIAAISLLYKHFKKKPVSPIVLILISGVMGVVLYGIFI